LARFLFFFQAEDGIRDFHVTGVQTCALPIFILRPQAAAVRRAGAPTMAEPRRAQAGSAEHATLPRLDVAGAEEGSTPSELTLVRSEERRVGKEGRSRCAA